MRSNLCLAICSLSMDRIALHDFCTGEVISSLLLVCYFRFIVDVFSSFLGLIFAVHHIPDLRSLPPCVYIISFFCTV